MREHPHSRLGRMDRAGNRERVHGASAFSSSASANMGHARYQSKGCRAVELTARERAIIDFEREWWQLAGPKEAEIRARFGCAAASYYRALQGLIDRPAARAYDPLTVVRLRRRRDQRRRERIEGRRADPESR